MGQETFPKLANFSTYDGYLILRVIQFVAPERRDCVIVNKGSERISYSIENLPHKRLACALDGLDILMPETTYFIYYADKNGETRTPRVRAKFSEGYLTVDEEEWKRRTHK